MLVPGKSAYDTHLRMLLNASGVGDWELDLTDMSLTSSARAKAHFGYGPDEPLTFRMVQEAIHPDDRRRVEAARGRAIENGGWYESEYRCVRPDGTVRWLEVRGITIADERGRPARLYGITRDITERRQAQESVAQLAAELETLVDGAPLGIFLVDHELRIRHVNPTAVPAFEISDLVGRDLAETLRLIWPLSDAEEIVRLFRRTLETGEPHEFPEFARERRDRGVTEYYEWRIDRIPLAPRDGAGPEGNAFGVVCYFRDISRLVLARKEAAASEARFRAVVDNLAQFAWTAEPDGWISWYNQRWYDDLGTTPDQMRGWGWRSVHHPDHVDRVVENYRRSFASGEPWEDIFPLRRHDGEYRWFLSRAVPVRDESGRIVQWIGTNTDVTEQRHAAAELEQHRTHLEELVRQRTAELEASHRRLRMTERMAMIGTLSAGLGHDMGNLLLPLRISLDLLEGAELPEPARASVAMIKTSVDYLQRLSKGLRLMAVDPERAAGGEITDLEKWWTDALPVLKNALPRRSGVTLEAPAAWPAEWGGCGRRVAISGVALMQVLFNLVQNAGEAAAEKWGGKPGGFVRIAVRREEPEGAEEDGRIGISVQDNGVGMTPDVQASCLEPYFSTKSREISMGMGLALVNTLVCSAGGEIRIQSAPGEGTTFEIKLPCAAPDSPPERLREKATARPGAQ